MPRYRGGGVCRQVIRMRLCRAQSICVRSCSLQLGLCSRTISIVTKYNAVSCVIDGVRFASKAEAERYCELRLLLRAGKISNLEMQPKFPISINGVKICTYVADFRYFSRDDGPQNQVGHLHVEDVKGTKTPIYRLKKKLVEALYPGVKIEEIHIKKRQFVK